MLLRGGAGTCTLHGRRSLDGERTRPLLPRCVLHLARADRERRGEVTPSGRGRDSRQAQVRNAAERREAVLLRRCSLRRGTRAAHTSGLALAAAAASGLSLSRAAAVPRHRTSPPPPPPISSCWTPSQTPCAPTPTPHSPLLAAAVSLLPSCAHCRTALVTTPRTALSSATTQAPTGTCIGPRRRRSPAMDSSTSSTGAYHMLPGGAAVPCGDGVVGGAAQHLSRLAVPRALLCAALAGCCRAAVRLARCLRGATVGLESISGPAAPNRRRIGSGRECWTQSPTPAP